jgi:hypothetical protein
VIYRQITKKRAAPDPNAPCAENTPGVLMEHFDLSTPYEDGEEVIIYGGYTLELTFTSAVIYLSIGFDANDIEVMHYEFTPESEPRLTPGIATHYSLYLGKSGPRSTD